MANVKYASREEERRLDSHAMLTTALAKTFLAAAPELNSSSRVLDVGCGTCFAIEELKEQAGMRDVIGITKGEDDLAKCRQLGYQVYDIDQHDISNYFAANSFDAVWARHILEHSVSPLFVMAQLAHVLRPGGWLYVEVPSPDTSGMHEKNPDHYSVMGMSMWQSLIGRAGFTIPEAYLPGIVVNFNETNDVSGEREETFFAFIAQLAA